MALRHLRINHFRNVKQIDWHPHHRLNVIWGANGQGKTSLLEAIYFLANMKSFRTSRTRDLITADQIQAKVEGKVENEGISHHLQLNFSATERSKKLDGKKVQKNERIYSLLQPILFSPDDVARIKGSPAGRRDLIDRAIFTERPAYVSLIFTYNRILKNRNTLLKQRHYDMLTDWNEGLAEYGARIRQQRAQFIRSVSPDFVQAYAEISSGQEEVGLVAQREENLETLRCELMQQIEMNAMREQELGTTLQGPHRDTIEFTLKGKSARRFASQGQQRSLILAFKIGQTRCLKRKKGQAPVLLLDDMTSELDRAREDFLIQFLAESEGQVFVTTTNVNLFDSVDQALLSTRQIDAGRFIN